MITSGLDYRITSIEVILLRIIRKFTDLLMEKYLVSKILLLKR